jgi:hypothetical protein
MTPRTAEPLGMAGFSPLRTLLAALRASAQAALVVGATLAGTPAHAQQQPPFMEGTIGLRGNGAVRLAEPAERVELERSPEWTKFTSRHGTWSVLWNARTGTPHRAYGEAIPLPGFADRADAVEAALRAFIGAEPGLFGTPTLETVRVQKVRSTWYVSFRQTLRGMPVLFSDWEFRVGSNGALFAFGADAHKVTDAAVPVVVRLPAPVVREAARAGMRFDPVRDHLEDGGALSVLPVAAEDGLTYRTVAQARIVTTDPPGDWFTLVDAGTGEVLWRQNRVHFDIGGTVSGDIHELLPTAGTVAHPFPSLTVNVGPTPATTNAGGGYSAPASGSVTVSAALAGAFCDVNRQDGTPDAVFSTPASNPSTVNIAWTAANSHDAERDGYYHVNVVHDYVRALDPGLTNLDYVALCNVNIAGSCNAFYDPGNASVNFYRPGGGCPNMATMPDVIYHEYGHGVNEHVYYMAGQPGGMFNGALHEGMADVQAAMIQDSPDVGKGFFGPGTVLRQLDNTAHWPENGSADGHISGLIIGGAFWDLRQSVGLAVTAQLSHFAKYGVPDDDNDGVAMHEFFVETVVADDDNANLGDGTPHLAEIVAAFNAHGIGTAQFMTFAHTPMADQPGNGPYPITAQVQYTGQFGGMSGTPTLHYAINSGSYQTAAMTPAGPPNQYSANIPGQPFGAVVSYYLSATDTYAQTSTLPTFAPAQSVYRFIAGPASTLVSHDMESEQGWVAGVLGDNATTGIWVRADPVGTSVTPGVLVQPDNDHTPDPWAICWVTGNDPTLQGAGFADVDGGKTTLLSAFFDATAGGLVNPVVSYYRWYTNDQGGSPGLDFWRTDISNDGGASWVPVESTQQSNNSWQRILFRIADYVTPTSTMRMRFVAEDAGAGSLVEAAVDDFGLYAFPTNPTAVGDLTLPGRLGLAVVSANPASGPMRLHYALPQASEISLRVYDLRGRAVRTLASGHGEAGGHTADWDGRDDRGVTLPSGTYFARLDAAGAATAGPPRVS